MSSTAVLLWMTVEDEDVHWSGTKMKFNMGSSISLTDRNSCCAQFLDDLCLSACPYACLLERSLFVIRVERAPLWVMWSAYPIRNDVDVRHGNWHGTRAPYTNSSENSDMVNRRVLQQVNRRCPSLRSIGEVCDLMTRLCSVLLVDYLHLFSCWLQPSKATLEPKWYIIDFWKTFVNF